MNHEYKKQLSREIEKKFSDLEVRVMDDIVRRIRKTGEITSTADWQINRLQILGNSSEDIEQMLKETLDASYPFMFELYDKVIDWEYVRNKDIYEQINQKFIPYEKNYILQQLTEGCIRQTKGALENITQSLGFYLDYGNGRKVLTPLSQMYQGYLDAAMLDITSGAFDYNSVLRRTVTQMTNSGLRSIDYASGHSNRVDVAARRAVMTGITQLSGQIADMNAEKLGTDYFEVEWHAGARPTHQVWQGRVYSREELVTVCGLGTVTGLEGANCYHSRYPFFPGISVRNWSDEWLEEKNREENTPKEFNGKEYTVYEAKQKQRQMETAMRAQREKVNLLQTGKADPDEIMLAKCKYQGQLNEYARFSKKMGLKEERDRIYLDMRGRVAPSQHAYKKWQAEQDDKLLKRAHKKNKTITNTGQNTAGSGIIKRKSGIPSSWIKGKPMGVQSAVSGVNPNYSTLMREWTQNCQRCVSAFEARMRGYDVQALPRILNGKDELPYMNTVTGWLSVYQNPVITNINRATGKACMSAIEQKMSEWGEGARAIVRVRWKSGGGHVFNAVWQEGKIVFVDAQSGRMDCSAYFGAGMIKPGQTKLIRIDNLEFTNRIELCAKQRGDK